VSAVKEMDSYKFINKIM